MKSLLLLLLILKKATTFQFSPKLSRFQSFLRADNVEFETNTLHNDNNLTLTVAESTLVPEERGLYLSSESPYQIGAGSIICGYGGQLGLESIGDKSVSYYLQVESLVVFDHKVQPLQSLLIEQKGITKLQGHVVSRYGPGNFGIRVSIDDSMKARTLIPREDDDLSWFTIGQYVNDHAFSEKLLNDASALWKYQEASNEKNHLMLCWNLSQHGDELVPDGVRCISRRDFVVDGCIELGNHYGLEFWRQIIMDGARQ